MKYVQIIRCLSRVSVEETGCQTILTHPQHDQILNRLLTALDITDSQRSTNIAFAIARLIEGEDGKHQMIQDCGESKFVGFADRSIIHELCYYFF